MDSDTDDSVEENQTKMAMLGFMSGISNEEDNIPEYNSDAEQKLSI